MKKPTANILLKGERLKAFSLRLEVRQGYSLSPFLFNIVLEVQANQIIQAKEIKVIPESKGRNKILYSQRTRQSI